MNMRLVKWILPLAPVIYLASFLARDRIPFHADTAWNLYAVQRWFWNQVLHGGEWPLWNEYLFNGYSFFGSPTHEVFSPLVSPFYILLPSFWAAIAVLTAALMVAILGMFKLSGEFTEQMHWRVSAALAFGFLGPVLSLVDRSSILGAVALYPWLAWTVIQLRQRATLGMILLWAVFVAGLVVHLDWAGAVAAVGLSLIAAVGLRGVERIRLLKSVAMGFVFAVLLSAVVWMPVQGNLPYTNRSNGLSYSENSEWSLNPVRLVQQIVPELWGSPYDHTFWGQATVGGDNLNRRFWFHSLFLGLPLFLLGLWGVYQNRRERLARIFFWASMFLILLSFGRFFPLHPLLYRHVSALAKFRYPEKFILFPLMIFLGFALAALRSYAAANERQIRVFWGAVGILHLVAPFLALLFVTGKIDAIAFAAIRHARYAHLIFAMLAFSILFFHRRAVWMIPLFVTAELLMFAPALKTVAWSTYTDHPRLENEAQFKKSTGRWVVDTANLEIADGRQVLVKDWAPLSGLRVFTAYDAVIPDRLPVPLSRLYQHLPRWADALNLEYLATAISPANDTLSYWENDHQIEKVYSDTIENLAVYKMARPASEFSLESAFIWSGIETFEKFREGKPEDGVFLERGSAGNEVLKDWIKSKAGEHTFSVTSQSANRRELTVITDGSALLVFRQSYHHGWYALVDGKRTPILRANYTSMAVVIREPGSHSVVLEFSPPEWWRGLLTSIFAALVALSIALVSRLRTWAF